MLSLILLDILEAEFIKLNNQLDMSGEREIIWIIYGSIFKEDTANSRVRVYYNNL